MFLALKAATAARHDALRFSTHGVFAAFFHGREEVWFESRVIAVARASVWWCGTIAGFCKGSRISLCARLGMIMSPLLLGEDPTC